MKFIFSAESFPKEIVGNHGGKTPRASFLFPNASLSALVRPLV